MLYQGQLECQLIICVFAQSFVILGFLTLFTILKYMPLRMLHRRASGPLRPALVPSPTPARPSHHRTLLLRRLLDFREGGLCFLFYGVQVHVLKIL